MQKYQKNYVGIDVSKPYFDASLMVVIDYQKQEVKSERFLNTGVGLKSFLKWLVKSKVSLDNNTLIVIENTGVYHRLIWKFCSDHGLALHIGNATHIKWSFGIARGKNDVIDSKRLCNYAFSHSDELQATPALNLIFLKLKDFMSSRTKMIKQLTSTKNFLKELKLSNDKSTQKILASKNDYWTRRTLAENKNIDDEIKEILSLDPDGLVRIQIAQRNDINIEIQERLANDKECNVRWSLAKNEIIDIKTQRILMRDSYDNVTRALMNNKKTDKTVLNYLKERNWFLIDQFRRNNFEMY